MPRPSQIRAEESLESARETSLVDVPLFCYGSGRAIDPIKEGKVGLIPSIAHRGSVGL